MRIFQTNQTKTIIRTFDKRKVYSPFIISKFNKGFIFLLSVVDIYSRYTWVIPLKGKKGITINNAFQKKFR